MPTSELFTSKKGTLRQRILTSVGAMVVLSLVSSMVSLYKITEVNRILEAINHVSVPLGRLFTQIQSDAEVFHRELERSLGYSHWKDPHWKPRPAPLWIQDVLESEMRRVNELIRSESEWTPASSRARWQEWANQISQNLVRVTQEAERLHQALLQKDEAAASQIYPKWAASVEEWKRQIQWGVSEYDRSLRQNFSTAETRVAELRTGMEVILIIVVLMSLLLLWLGERALRPLADLTSLAREITRRGLRKADKSLLPEISLTRSDEVSQLAREFHHMATALLEREKTVESQKNRLQDQNRLLLQMGELNENILKSIKSILIVTDLESKITQCNPQALSWLGVEAKKMIGSDLVQWPLLQSVKESFPHGDQWIEKLKATAEILKLDPLELQGKVYGGSIMPLKGEDGLVHGAIIVLDDLTEEVDLQDRLRRAENLAAVGRMSAQVAHEVRNPLHSIGLEAEIAAEMAARLGDPPLKQSLQSILTSVDRLQKITENYLKLSRLSSGQKATTNVGEILVSVLSTYAPVCEVQGVRVHWKQESGASLKVWADQDLLEQVFGNLFRNSLQALELGSGFVPSSSEGPQVTWSLGNTENGMLWIRIEDNGPGIDTSVRSRLFTPFVTTRAHGTGLGLSFVKQVLEDHGGVIRNMDPSSGVGACFDMFLPLIEEVSYAENIARG
jgi:nitrogen fixation/metabolism regulation signal transduction histidine kinase